MQLTVAALLVAATLVSQPMTSFGANNTVTGLAGTAARGFNCTPLPPEQRTQLFGNLGGFSHKIATRSPKAQRYFDEGLMHAFDFNRPQALVAFQAAAAEDPAAPAPHWGAAYAMLPYLNKVAAPDEGTFPVFSEQDLAKGRWEAQLAVKLANAQLRREMGGGLKGARSIGPDPRCLALMERDTVYATGVAGVYGVNATYGPQLEAAFVQYAAQLEEYATSHDDHPDSLALAAEALANTQPWAFWTVPDLHPRAHTPRILSLLQRALARDPSHPLATHLLVHATEAGPDPGLAEAAADHLLARFPQFGHLAHMPSHTYIRIGRWRDGVVANEESLQAGLEQASKCAPPYAPHHNAQMLVYAAATGSDLQTALRYARDMRRYPLLFGPTYGSDGRDNVAEVLVRIRFGEWDGVMNTTFEEATMAASGVMVPPGEQVHSHAMLHFARVMALAAASGPSTASPTQNSSSPMLPPAGGASEHGIEARQKAQRELAALEAAVQGMPPDPITKPGAGIGIHSPGYQATGLHALHVARARLAVVDGDWAVAEEELRAAIHVEDGVGYTEPPRFHQPMRECLAWVMLAQGNLTQAAQVYQQDLEEFPRSPWSLVGLQQVYMASDSPAHHDGKVETPPSAPSLTEVDKHLSQLAEETQGAAVTLPSSCPSFSESWG